MNYIQILENATYLPGKRVENEEIENRLGLERGYIYKRTGVKYRYFSEIEKIEELAVKAVKKILEKANVLKEEIGLIIVATTSTNKLMPGISNFIQREINIEKCICLDILAGCNRIY